MKKDPRLGKQGEDVITGFKGTIIGVAQYLTGCTQLGLVPKMKEDGKVDGTEWFDEGRVTLTDDGAILPKDVKGNEDGGPNRDMPR